MSNQRVEPAQDELIRDVPIPALYPFLLSSWVLIGVVWLLTLRRWKVGRQRALRRPPLCDSSGLLNLGVTTSSPLTSPGDVKGRWSRL